ncbi:lipid IV(A) palmitoyltransferase PagP [Desulfovibrio cuneatus]|uniref:lipid IV(A) palmitoyltransferase PagP n=1 Tax=Desulfovibrio cuneatus TaxID=159728 RepID=UPI00041EF4A4|nr:lipid IV(A) palmitoyltransferase PagP [Desulfovibrio cuneatus]
MRLFLVSLCFSCKVVLTACTLLACLHTAPVNAAMPQGAGKQPTVAVPAATASAPGPVDNAPGSAPAAPETTYTLPAAEAAEGESPSLLTRIGQRFSNIWENGKWDVYVPAYAWHNRFMYHTGEAEKFNEHPWGGGFGKSYFDEDGDQHSLYTMGFMDSNDRFQPIVGYAYIKNWKVFEDFSLGLGFTAGITARHEYHYIPLPGALPIVSMQYKNVAIQATYIPERYNHGNVLFTWFRYHFN